MKRAFWGLMWVIVFAETIIIASSAYANPAMMLDLLYWIRR